ncbi:MAG: DsrE family protein [Nitrospirae bacterium]|nr:DsrE family protein [Nitrospirota bacterium]
MKNIAIILRRSPYGDINAAEAVRHAMGGVADDLSVALILVDSGVLLAKQGQDDTETGFTNLGEVLTDCMEMGVDVYSDKRSIREQNMDTADIPEGIKVVTGPEIADIIKSAKTTMIY